jgi:hypothetical protein
VTYTLSRLAPGSYDVLLKGVIVASLVRSGRDDCPVWTAELLEDVPSWRMPAPFKKPEHSFASLGEVQAWLGNPEIRDTGQMG